MSVKLKNVRIDSSTEKQLQTIRLKYGLMSDAAAFRIAVALTAGESK
jgi:hypothetical protein